MREKLERQRAVMKLVRQRAVHNQHELVQWLESSGISATQASVSRDIRELGLVKANGRYVPAGRLGEVEPGDDGPVRWNELITGIEPVGANLLIVHTTTGSASPVAIEIDRHDSPDVAGTIAGDDTVFVAVRSRSAQGRVMAMLRNLSAPASV